MPLPSDLNRPLALLAASTLWDAVGGGAVVIACSGGPDSVALARAAFELLSDPQFASQFQKLPRLILWHLDHGLRESSVREAQFVEELAQQLKAEALVERVELGQRLADEGGNLEAEARRERYTRLLALLEDKHNWRALTAHHLDDQAETVLHHLIRGTHLPGLRGIAPVYRGVIFRPWLILRRSEIISYLDSRSQSYMTDPSNADVAFTRNRLRLEVLPLLTQINANALEHIAQLASVAREAVDLKHEQLAQLEVQIFNADELARWLPLFGWPQGYEVHRLWEGWVESGQLGAYVAHLLGERCGTPSSAEHEEIAQWASDPDIALSIQNVNLELAHEQLLTIETPVGAAHARPENAGQKEEGRPWAAPTDVVNIFLEAGTINYGGLTIELVSSPSQRWQLFQRRDKHVWEQMRNWPAALATLCSSPPQAPAWECYLQDVQLPLRLRTWRVGERMQLAGGGSSTIGDLFTNAKVPEPLRWGWCVLADAQDNALWLPGIADGVSMRVEGEPELLVRIQIAP